MDEALRVLASRYTDGDLDKAESSRLEAQAETDPELASEISATRELRAAVRTIAERMEPPVALDRVMEPLRQGPPPPARQVRPVYRWLGIAAAVVLGVTVATEMARRHPGPTPSPTPSQNHRIIEERDEIFKLAPLPTAVPNDNRPLGAADHLLEEEPALPAASEPAPLEVIGPLNAAAPSMSPAESTSDADPRSKDEAGGLELRSEETARPAPGKKGAVSRTGGSMELKTEAESMRQQRPTDDHLQSRVEPSAVGQPSPGRAAGGPPSTETTIVVLIDDVVVWTGSSASCQIGRWEVQIEVAGDAVSTLAPVIAEGVDQGAVACIPEGLIGSRLEGVDNGIHRGELIVKMSRE